MRLIKHQLTGHLKLRSKRRQMEVPLEYHLQGGQKEPINHCPALASIYRKAYP